jgi:peptidoglycan hydrolase-like protein with peptidoglycan-binding domain
MGRYITVVSLACIVFVSMGVAQTRRTGHRYHATGAQTKGAPKQKAPPPPTYDLAAVNNPATVEALKENDAGTAALRAQILLDRAHFSVGEIDGRVGANMLRALNAFRAARGLPRGDMVDEDVWKALNAVMGETLSVYTITADDLDGPFIQVPPP